MTTPVVDPMTATGRRVYFVAPHADDDTISMGWAASHHAREKRRLSFVLGSTGATTGALDDINGDVDSAWWGGRHFPDREEYERLTPAGIALARDAEFMDACALLGAVPGEIHLERELRVDSPDVDDARKILLKYRELDPDAGFYTMHWLDSDQTHRAFGEALLDLHTESPADWLDVRWMVRESQAGTIAGAQQYPVPATQYAACKIMIQQAARAYSAWAPQQGRFAVGYHSVGRSLFPGVVAGNPNWIVRP